MVTLSPVGLAAAPVANQVSFLATFKEKLCRCVCATSTNQPFATVTINQLGMTQGLIKIVCEKSNCYAINSSLSVSIPAEPAV